MLNEIKIYCLASQPSIDVCTWRIASWLLDGRLKALGQGTSVLGDYESVPPRLTVNQINGLLVNDGEGF